MAKKGSSVKQRKNPLAKRDNQWIGLIFTLPFILGFIFIFSKIFIVAIQFAFSTLKMGTSGFSLTYVAFENFRYALRVDPQYLQIMLQTLKAMLTNIPSVIIFSLFVAVLLNRKTPGKTVFRAIFFIPVILATGLISKLDMNNAVMTAMGNASIETGTVSSAASSLGNVSTFLQGLNFSPSLITTVTSAAAGVVGIVTLSGVQILIFLAGIQSISPSIYEAASVEGATAWEMFWKITLPMVSPMLLVNIFYTIIDSLSRDNNLLMDYIRSIAFNQGQYGRGAAMAWLYFILVAIILTIVVAIVSKFVFTYQRDK